VKPTIHLNKRRRLGAMHLRMVEALQVHLKHFSFYLGWASVFSDKQAQNNSLAPADNSIERISQDVATESYPRYIIYIFNLIMGARRSKEAKQQIGWNWQATGNSGHLSWLN
jgi:hypothetical protein